MNARELFTAGGEPSGLWQCAACKRVSLVAIAAEECCRPYKCDMCGCEIPRKLYRTRCSDCIEKADRARMRERMDRAQRLDRETPYCPEQEWFWCEHGSSRNEGYGSWDELMEAAEEWLRETDPADRPEHIVMWVAGTEPLVKVNSMWLTEHIADNAWDEFDIDDLNGLDELEEALRKFNEANSSLFLFKDLWQQYYLVPVSEFDIEDECNELT